MKIIISNSALYKITLSAMKIDTKSVTSKKNKNK